MEENEELQNCLHNLAVASYRIRTYLSGFNETKFLKNIKTQDAVRFCLLKLDEAAKDLFVFKKNLTEEYPNFPTEIAVVGSTVHFEPDELWEILKDEFDGIWQYLTKFEKMYELERQPQSEKRKVAKHNLFATEKISLRDSDSSLLDTNYKYSTKSTNSIWTVRKK